MLGGRFHGRRGVNPCTMGMPSEDRERGGRIPILSRLQSLPSNADGRGRRTRPGVSYLGNMMRSGVVGCTIDRGLRFDVHWFVDIDDAGCKVVSRFLICFAAHVLPIAVSSVPGGGPCSPYRVRGASEDLQDEAMGDQRSEGEVQVLVRDFAFFQRLPNVYNLFVCTACAYISRSAIFSGTF